MKDFSDRLRILRRSVDMTQQQLADYLGVTPSAIGKYEKHEDLYPSIKDFSVVGSTVCLKIADYFQVSIDYLLRGEEYSPSAKNNVSGALMNSTVIQAGRNNNSSLNNATSCSSEALGLLDIYNKLTLKDRLRLLNFAVELDEGSGQE